MKLKTRDFNASVLDSWLLISLQSGVKGLRTRHQCSPIEEPQLTEMLAKHDEDSKPQLSISELRAITNDGVQESVRLQKIPTKMRREILNQLHEAHQGVVRTKQ